MCVKLTQNVDRVHRLSDETARVEDALTEASSIEALLRMFTKAKATTFENLLDPLLKVMKLVDLTHVNSRSLGVLTPFAALQLFRMSPAVGTALTSQSAFARRLVDRLLGHNKAVVRLNLLRLTKAVYETASDKSAILKMPGLTAGIAKMADSESAILVRELAKELNREFTAMTTSSLSKARRTRPVSQTGVSRIAGSDTTGCETPRASKRNVPGSEPPVMNLPLSQLASRGLSRDQAGNLHMSHRSSSASNDLFGRGLRRPSPAGAQRKS